MLTRVAALGGVLACALLAAASAQSSRPVASDARVVSLTVNDRGEALLTYRSGGVTRHVLSWGTNDIRLDYSGGWRRHGREYWRGFEGSCRRYKGPRLAYELAACTAPDGSYWAVQGIPQRSFEISHWRGPLAKVQTGMAWAYGGRFQVLFGRVTYGGRPSGGLPLRLDSFRGGWNRTSPFATHDPSGAFCYGLYPSGGGPGTKYRLAVSGPAGTPLLVAGIPGLHDFDRSKSADLARQAHAAARLKSWGVSGSDEDCGPLLRMAAKLKGKR
jgi:hypothetical protein